MNKFLILFVGFLCVIFASAIEIMQVDRIYFDCHNILSGAWEGTTATLTCYDSSGNIDVNGESATNIATGRFYYIFSETNDRYYCFIDCGETTSIDYTIPIWQRTMPLTSTDNIGVNLDDVVGTLDRATETTGFLTTSDNIGINWADIINQNAVVDLSATNFNLVDTCTDITNGVTLTPTTEAQIDAIEADTNELQQNQNWDVWDDTTRTLTVADWTTDSDLQDLENKIFNGTLGTSDLTASEVDAVINSSHGTGLYNTSSTASISQSDKNDIALLAFRLFIQNRTVLFTYDANGYPYIDTYTYSESGDTETRTWGVSGNDIVNYTVVRS